MAPVWRYLVATAATAGAFALTWLLPDAMQRPFFLFFIAAAGLSAWNGGWIPGLLSVGLGALATAYFFLNPQHHGFNLHPLDHLRLGLFTASSVFIVWLFAELRSTQLALQHHADRFRRAQRSANIAAFDWEMATGRLLWSEELPVFRQLVPDGSSRSWARFVHPEDLRRVKAAIDQAVASGAETNVDLRLVPPDDAVRWIAARGQVFYDENGAPVRMLGVAMDITDRKTTESRLEAQHAITRALVESANPAEAMPRVMRIACKTLDWPLCQLWTLDPDENLLRRTVVCRETSLLEAFEQENASLTFARGSGLPGRVWASAQPAWVEDLSSEEAASPRAPAFTRARLRSAFAFPVLLDSRVMGVMEFFSLHPRHTDRELLETAADLGAQMGQFIERRRAQEALRDSEERYRTTLSSIGDAVIAVDAQGCVQFLNAVAQGLTGWSQREAVRRPLNDVFRVVRENGHEPLADPVRRVLEQGTPAVQEDGAVLQARDGRETPIDDSAAPIRNDAGELIGVVLVFRDVRSRRRTEEALRSSEKLAATGRLAASIAHEINNPMEAVTNLLYLIENNPGLDDTTREYARLAEQELGRMDRIVKQTLGFYRESAEPVAVCLTSVLDNVLELYARRIQRARIQVRKRYRFEGEIKAFPGEMRQVFSNLVSNALEALGEGGEIAVHVSRARDWGAQRVPGVRVTVADNGIGITRDNLQRIFDPFFTTKGINGTGLGLWITYGIVQKHGGKIIVRSCTGGPRRGTSFSVLLPDSFLDISRPGERTGADSTVPSAA